MSQLNVLIRGYLLARCGYDRYSRELLIREADRLRRKYAIDLAASMKATTAAALR